MAKGKRADLEELLETASNRQKWAAAHGRSIMAGKKSPIQEGLQRAWEFLAVLIGIIGTLEVTLILPGLYWPFVATVYFGFAAVIYNGYTGKWHRHPLAKFSICLLGVVGMTWWSLGVVFAKADLVVDASPNGTSEARVFLMNQSDYDLKELYLNISVDGALTQITQLEPVCQGFSAFVGERPPEIDINTKEGKRHIVPGIPGIPSYANRMRVVCDKLPRGNTAILIAPIAPTAFGSDPNNPFPETFSAPGRIPKWLRVEGDYWALGKKRPVNKRISLLSK
jgi:hypothetical protein